MTGLWPQGEFSRIVVAWQRRFGRHGLPWQGTRDPYRVWLSEVMLQQTQVTTALPYYTRFVARFPDVQALAEATPDEVFAHWAGLGYYSRARNLHRAARMVVSSMDGRFPPNAAGLAVLPGVGRSTAAAVAAFCYDECVPILDGNVRRVLCRVFGVAGDPGARVTLDQLWRLAEELVPDRGADMPAYTQGLMDLGAQICVRSRPLCATCPLESGCVARREDRIAELPAPRARAKVLTVEMALQVFRRPDQVWVVRRPERGIWAGLWCLPEVDGSADELAAGWVEVGRLEHRLTHRLLQIRLCARDWLADVDPPGAGRWVGAQALRETGLPAPVRSWLETEGLQAVDGAVDDAVE